MAAAPTLAIRPTTTQAEPLPKEFVTKEFERSLESGTSERPSLLKQAAQSKGLQRWVLIEALVGSVLILAAPFLGDYLAPHGVGGKVLGVVFAVAHYGFHVIGGAVLFKAGLDIGSLSHCHSHKH